MKLHLALFAILFFTVTVYAEQPPFDASRYVTAIEEFEALAQNAQERRTMPRIADPRTADVLRALFDARILSAKKYGTQDLDFLLKVCGRASDINVSYMLFDAKSQIDTKSPPSDTIAKLQKLMQRNAEVFQDEMAISLPFTIRCFAAQMPLLTEFMESLHPEELTETRKAGIRKVRDGTMTVYQGALTIAGQGGITQANKLTMLTALAETASAFSKPLAVDQRKLIAKAVDSVLPDTPDAFRDHLLKIQRDMSNADCTDLCKF